MKVLRCALATIAVGLAAGTVAAPSAQKPKPLPTGSLSLADASTKACPAASRCQAFTVSCPGVRAPARGSLSIRRPSGRARGVVVFFSGAAGKAWWAKGPAATAFLADLTSVGLVTVQVSWKDSWLRSSDGELVGPAALACRPATVIAWIRAKIYGPLRIPRTAKGLARCGFCITGNSAGATQASYALTHFGLDRMLDAVILTGGPPHGAMAKGCLRRPGESTYWFARWAADIMDASYGFRGSTGPCANADGAFERRWQRDSVATGGIDYNHPRTRVVFLFGRNDRSEAIPQARDYATRLGATSPAVSVHAVRGGHQLAASADALAALRLILVETPRASGGR